MAAVKTQRGGPRREPVFRETRCDSCAGALTALRDAWRVRTIAYVGAKRQTRWCWYHRGCSK